MANPGTDGNALPPNGYRDGNTLGYRWVFLGIDAYKAI